MLVLNVCSVGPSRVMKAVGKICSANRSHYRGLSITHFKMLQVKSKGTSKASIEILTFDHFLDYVSCCSWMWALHVKMVCPIYEQWKSVGGNKKPVLISCDLVFPAGFSSEWEAAAAAWRDQRVKHYFPVCFIPPHLHHFQFSFLVVYLSSTWFALKLNSVLIILLFGPFSNWLKS